MFEKALKQKLRFDTSKGQVSTEDLWDLSLTKLDEIAKAVNRQIKDSQEESFIETKTKKSTEDELKLEVLKFVIADKIASRDASKARAEKQAKIAQLKQLMVAKQNEALANSSTEDIARMLQELGADIDAEVEA